MKPNDPDDVDDRLRDLHDGLRNASDMRPDAGKALDEAVTKVEAWIGKAADAPASERADMEVDLLNDGVLLSALSDAPKDRHHEVDALLMGLRRGYRGAAKVADALGKNITRARKHAKAAALGFKVHDGGGNAPSTEIASRLHAVLGSHPIPTLMVPDGWEISPRGIGRMSGQGDVTSVNHSPILVTGRLEELDGDRVHLNLEWPTGGRWSQRIVSRDTAMTAVKLRDLSAVGAPVSSTNANNVVAWLDALESRNHTAMPTAHASARMGWCGENGRLGFLAGRRLVTEAGDLAAIDPKSSPVEWPDDWVYLDAEEGFAQIANGYTTAGTLDGWRSTIERCRPYPAAFLALYASLSAPLLMLLPGAKSFIIDWAFTSSTGKTTTLRVAGSAWGKPDDKDGVIRTWDGSMTNIERTLYFGSYLPMLLDDSKRAKRPEDIPRMLYMIAQGQGSGRGKVMGVQSTVSWSTVALSTGEVPITSFSQDVGARARTICIQEKPFGEASQETRSFVELLTIDLLDNHGHAGPEFVRYLMRHRKDWPKWREAHAARTKEWAERLSSRSPDTNASQFAGRAAPYLATLQMAAGIAERALGIPYCAESLEVAAKWVRSGAADADRASAALEVVFEWSISNRSRFWERGGSNTEPVGGWVGSVIYGKPNDDGSRNLEHLCFVRVVIERLLTEHGFDAPNILAEWWDREWLRTNESGRRTFRTQVGSGRVKAIAIRGDVLSRVCDPPLSADGGPDA